MTEQEYKQAKQVLADAPRGATHVDDEDYLKGSKGKTFALWMNNAWCFYAKASKNARSLSDIRTIVEQYEEIQAYKAKVAELEKEVADHKANIDHLMNNCHRFTDKRLQEHNLEQQARGIKDACDFANDKCINGGGYFGRDYESMFKQNGAFAFKSACMLYLKQLRNQARGE